MSPSREYPLESININVESFPLYIAPRFRQGIRAIRPSTEPPLTQHTETVRSGLGQSRTCTRGGNPLAVERLTSGGGPINGQYRPTVTYVRLVRTISGRTPTSALPSTCAEMRIQGSGKKSGHRLSVETNANKSDRWITSLAASIPPPDRRCRSVLPTADD